MSVTASVYNTCIADQFKSWKKVVTSSVTDGKFSPVPVSLILVEQFSAVVKDIVGSEP